MNLWEVIRHEIDGAVRSLRYDLANRRGRRAMQEQTEELPIIAPARASKTVILATTAGLAVAGSISGYAVFTGGLDSLFARGDAPAGLPMSPAKPDVSSSPTPARVAPPTKSGPKVPVALASSLPRPIPTSTIFPPVPTPAPTCHCVTPSPTGSPNPSGSPNPTGSPNPSGSPSSSASPTPSASSTRQTIAPTSAATR